MRSRYDHLIVGSGFAGSLLARILSRHGRSVLLVDRACHPRFALGESTTPLANIALERLARAYDLPELEQLATHGRWVESFPEVLCGLKRGFSFYRHEPGEHWRAGADRRLLVAASPNDAVSDVQWLRSGVDRLLARLAVADGAELSEETEVVAVGPVAGGVRAVLSRGGVTHALTARSVVDASGPAAAVARRLGATDGAPTETSSHLLSSHFRGVRTLCEVTEESSLVGAPYPEDWAAVHHLLNEGWMYLLRFDDGLVSAGVLIDAGGTASSSLDDPDSAWWRLIERYPTLSSLFAEATPVRPISVQRRIQHRLSRAFGSEWVATPHTYGFVDPLFSVGIAWSLRGVERLAEMLLAAGPNASSAAAANALPRYENLLAAEMTQIDRLVATAYKARRRFDLFAAHAMLYFAWVSYAESRERLCQPGRPWWSGFLGAGDASFEALLAESAARIEAVLDGDFASTDYQRWIAEVIEPFNVAGLANSGRGNLYPADLQELVGQADKLGLERAVVEAALPELLGQAT